MWGVCILACCFYEPEVVVGRGRGPRPASVLHCGLSVLCAWCVVAAARVAVAATTYRSADIQVVLRWLLPRWSPRTSIPIYLAKSCRSLLMRARRVRSASHPTIIEMCLGDRFVNRPLRVGSGPWR